MNSSSLVNKAFEEVLSNVSGGWVVLSEVWPWGVVVLPWGIPWSWVVFREYWLIENKNTTRFGRAIGKI